MKRLTAILPAALLAAAMAGPASAAPPDDFVVTVQEENEVDPCTGEEHDVTVTFNVHEVTTSTGVVASITTELATSHGYEGRGTNTFRTNSNRISETFAHVLRNDETGGMYRVSLVAYFNERTEVFYVEETRQCIRAPQDA